MENMGENPSQPSLPQPPSQIPSIQPEPHPPNPAPPHLAWSQSPSAAEKGIPQAVAAPTDGGSSKKDLWRLLHVYSKVLELLLQSDVAVLEGPDAFLFATTGTRGADVVRVRTLSIHTGVLKVVVQAGEKAAAPLKPPPSTTVKQRQAGSPDHATDITASSPARPCPCRHEANGKQLMAQQDGQVPAQEGCGVTQDAHLQQMAGPPRPLHFVSGTAAGVPSQAENGEPSLGHDGGGNGDTTTVHGPSSQARAPASRASGEP